MNIGASKIEYMYAATLESCRRRFSRGTTSGDIICREHDVLTCIYWHNAGKSNDSEKSRKLMELLTSMIWRTTSEQMEGNSMLEVVPRNLTCFKRRGYIWFVLEPFAVWAQHLFRDHVGRDA